MSSNDRERDGSIQLRLNFDVLRLICNYLTEVSDVLSFALTCSTLRESALQRRLKMAPVVLPRPDSIERFYSFIFADPASRGPYLYGLKLLPCSEYTPNDDPHFIDCLVAIMEAATQLEYLYFPTTIGHSVCARHSGSVCAAVAKMSRLRELHVISGVLSHTQREPEALSRLLAALRCPLQHLTIENSDWSQVSANFLHNDLRHFAPTLKYLSLDLYCDICPSSVTAPFTALRSLHIVSSCCQPRFVQMDVLRRLFPNLSDTLLLYGFTPPVDQYQLLRDQSKEAQKEHTWSGLDRVVCRAEVAFMMALRCPIRRMNIGVLRLFLHQAPYIAQVLRDSCPRKLLLPISFSDYDHVHNLRELFPPEAAGKLTHLVLFAEINVDQRRQSMGESRRVYWGQLTKSIIDAMKHLRLTHLRIIFHYYTSTPEPESANANANAAASEPADSEEGFTQDIARDADLHPTALRLLYTVQTLEYVFLTICGVHQCGVGRPWKYWHSSGAWRRVVGGSRGWCVETLSDEVAKAVIDEEELGLESREEDMVWQCVEFASE